MSVIHSQPQKKYRRLLASYLFLIGISLSACVKVSNTSLHIPSDVFFAARANILRATYQVPNWKDILRQEFSIDVESDSTSKTNFLASGKAYIFGNMTQGEQNYIAFALSIYNKNKLEDFITTLNPDLTIHHYKHFTYLVKNKSLLAWSKNTLILLDAPQTANEAHLEAHFHKIADVKKQDALISTNENFRQVLRNDYDVSLWINNEELRHSPLLANFARNTSLANSYIHLQSKFDEGVIATETQFFVNEALEKNYGEIFTRELNQRLLSNLPIQKPVALVGVSVNPDQMFRVLIDFNLIAKANNLATSTTFTLPHFLKMLSGDVVFALKDIPQEDSLKGTPKNKKAISDYVLGVGLRSRPAFDQLVAVMEKTGMLTNQGKYYHFFNEIYVMPSDTLVYFTKNPQIKDDFLKGLVLNQPALLEKAKDNFFMVYANEAIAQKTVKGKTMVKEIARNLLGNENLQLNEAHITLSTVGSKKEGGKALILLKDEMENSLLAMLEVLKEVVSQTKIRLDPNYYNPD